MPPNPPSKSSLPRLAVWSGYGTVSSTVSIQKLCTNCENFVHNILHQCYNPPFYVKSFYLLARLVSAIKKLSFCDIRAIVFLQSHVIMKGRIQDLFYEGVHSSFALLQHQ